jgi:Tfp pilus assembly protein PilO
MRDLIDELGTLGMMSIGVILLTAMLTVSIVKPLEERKARMVKELQAEPREAAWKRVNASRTVDQFDAFYRFFQRGERLDEWLAKLYGAASAAGVELKTGDYRLDPSQQRIARYQITLPVTGSYGELRAFIQAVLTEMPVLSLDQLSFRRKGPNEARIEAELSFSLYVARE